MGLIVAVEYEVSGVIAIEYILPIVLVNDLEYMFLSHLLLNHLLLIHILFKLTSLHN